MLTGHQAVIGHQQLSDAVAVFAKVFRFLPDIRSGKQIFFTSPNKNLPDRIKRADLVKKKKKTKQKTVWSSFLLYSIKNNTH